MTLIELLVVVTIVVVLLALAVPLMRPAISEGYLREASRQVNTYLAGARARAAHLEREVGVRFQRTAPGANSCVNIVIVESPPLYAGDTYDARAVFDAPQATRNNQIVSATFDARSASLQSLVRVGDFIQFDYKGPLYEVTRIIVLSATNTRLEFAPPRASRDLGPDGKGGRPDFDDDQDGTMDEADEANPYASGSDDGPTPTAVYSGVASSVAYQIYRQPVKSIVKPLQLTGGSCVDLGLSGFGAAGQQFGASSTSDNNYVEILFGPDGSITRVAYGGSTGTPPSGSVFLMIGRMEQLGVVAERTNLQDATASWIAVSERTGLITSAENDATGTDVASARIFARSSQSMGGR